VALAGLTASADASVAPASIPSPAAAIAAANQARPLAIGLVRDPRPGLLAALTNFRTTDACGPAVAGSATCLAQVVTPLQVVATANASLPSGYGPADLQSAYDVDTTQGAGNAVAIVDAYDDPNAAADLATYRATYGLPACTVANGCFHEFNQKGAPSPLPSANSSWAAEESLDVDMVSAICPLCQIDLVEANSSSVGNLAIAAGAAAKLAGVKAISNSYGGSELKTETAWDSYYNHPGIITTAASGDSGYGTSYPAADPGITAVGATVLTRGVATARGWTETAWARSGSGCSVYEAKPAWQHDTSCAMRSVADVSAVGSTSTPVAMYDTYSAAGWRMVGGTSVASPVVASIAAMANADFRASGNASGFYEMAPGYVGSAGAELGINDVTSGTNGTCAGTYMCAAGVGYDGPSGIGSVATIPRSSIGYVLAANPTTASYTPISADSYNSYRAINTVTRASTGVYTVTFPDLASGGTVDVTACGANVHCSTSGWSHSGAGVGSAESVGVNCFDSAGAPADAAYDVSFVDPAGQAGSINPSNDSFGFVLADTPTSASYTPSSQYNDLSLANTITRASAGVYTVSFTGLAPVPTTDQGTAKVTAYATNDVCVGGPWTKSTSSSAELLTVRCTTPAGVPADAQFTATYAADLALAGAPGSPTAYLSTTAPSFTAAYNVMATWSFNSTGGTNQVQRTSVGNYSVTLPGLTAGTGDVQVTSLVTAATSCRTNGWSAGAGGTTVSVECVNSAGADVDNYFTLQYFS
jgi:hypothetical protein